MINYKKNIFALLATLISFIGYAQSFYLGDSAKLSVRLGTTFFFGGKTTLNGPVTNVGTIVSYSDMDFVTNSEVGNLKFTGVADQQLLGDTLFAGDFEIDKDGTLDLVASRGVRVLGSLITTRGVIQSTDERDLAHTGSVVADGTGYVEGILYGAVPSQPTTFPMGLNGFTNYITLTSQSTGIYRVVCKPPIPALLFPDEDIEGITEQVEWGVTRIGTDSSQVSFIIDYSGIDFNNFTNGSHIVADNYQPAIALFYPNDTLHHALSTRTNFVGTVTAPSGSIESPQLVWITSTQKRVNMALVPVAAIPFMYIPNVFAPNAGTAENQIFRPFVSGDIINKIAFTVFDSFSQVVYDFQDSGSGLDVSLIGWDGILPSGQEAPDGLYYYSVFLAGEKGTYPANGNPHVSTVLLIR